MMNGDGEIENSALVKVKITSCNLLDPLGDAPTQLWMNDES